MENNKTKEQRKKRSLFQNREEENQKKGKEIQIKEKMWECSQNDF
jgi:hypothetical protein